MIIDRGQVAAALPGYELGDQLGRGAFGLVLAARHRELDRHVAVKVVSAGHTDATGFTAEARLLARLDHPHVVRVYDYLKAGDLRLIVMELLAGGSLADRQRAGISPETACAAGLAIAAALSCAHSQNVLHRDVKPDNVLFDATGLLKVTDFGIAKIVEGSAASAATASTAGHGTPAYMAPEQILGHRLRPATDLYALGVVLYKLLAGALPFDPAGGVQALWRHHLDTIAAPLPAGVPSRVAHVVLRALAKGPADRPSTAHAFALDLAAAATDAYGPGWAARSGLVLRLDDDVRDAAGHIPTPTRPTPLPAAGNDPPPARQADDRPPQAGASGPPRADNHPPQAPQAAAGGAAALADDPRRLSRGDVPEGSDRDEVPESHSGRRPRRLVPRTPPLGRTSRRQRILAVAILPLLLIFITGTVLAVKTGSGKIGAQSPESAATPQTLTTTLRPDPLSLGAPLEGHADAVISMAFAPDGDTLATSGSIDDRTVRLWDVADSSNPQPLGAPLEGHTSGVRSVAFAPDGKVLASGSWDRTVRLWDVADPADPRLLGVPLEGNTSDVESVAFAPGGKTVLAAGGGDGTVRLWDVAAPADPQALGVPLESHTSGVFSVAFSPDGKVLATGGGDGTVRLWDVADPANPEPLGAPLAGHTDYVWAVAFAPDGKVLATGSDDDTVRLWDVADPAHPRRLGGPLDGHTVGVFSVAFAPDGKVLATGSDDNAVRLWDVADPANPQALGAPLAGHTDYVWAVAFAPNGTVLATGSNDDTVRLWAVP